MSHPSDATLALYAGRDLGTFARWRTKRHLASCARCRGEVDAYAEVRDALPEAVELPDVPWARLAADMKANIRLGVEAGECVREAQPARRESVPLFGTRALVCYASIAALVAASVLLERPTPRPSRAKEGITLEATANGIEWKGGGQALSLLHGRASNVTLTVSAQGSMRARYVDSDTGYVTINNVYAQ